MNDIPIAPLPPPPPPSSSIPCPPSPPTTPYQFSFFPPNAAPLPPFAPPMNPRSRPLAFTDTVASILQRRRTNQRSFHHLEMDDDDEELDGNGNGISVSTSVSTCTSASTSPRTRMATPQPLNIDEDDLVFELEGWEHGTTPTHMEDRPENPMSRFLIQRERRIRVHRSNRGIDGEPVSPVWASSPALTHASPLRAPRHPSFSSHTHRPRLDSLSEQPSSPSISTSIPSSPAMGPTSTPIACQRPSSITATATSSSSSLPPPASPLILASPPRLPKHQHQLRPPATAISLWSHITPLELDGDASPISTTTTTSITTPSPFTTTTSTTTTPSPFPAQSPIPMPSPSASPFPSTLFDPLRHHRIRTPVPYSSRILHFNPKGTCDMSDIHITSSIPVQPSALSHALSHHIRHDKEERRCQPIASMGD